MHPAPFPPEKSPELHALIFRGRKIEAIKLHREHTGLGLKEAKDAVEALEATLDGLGKRFGQGAVMRLGERPHAEVETISTGSFTLDELLGVGGWPRGRVVEIFGPESSGKTTLALHAVAEVQARGGTAAFVDAEHALDVT